MQIVQALIEMACFFEAERSESSSVQCLDVFPSSALFRSKQKTFLKSVCSDGEYPFYVFLSMATLISLMNNDDEAVECSMEFGGTR